MVGPWGECSKDLHALVKVMGETKVAARARERGRQASDNELGLVICQIRKYLSTAFVRAQSLCLINRLWGKPLCHKSIGPSGAVQTT